MSRRGFHHYLLYYLSVSAILVYGSSRRIPRSCPSCSQDCPEALVNPWYFHRESHLQPGNSQDFSNKFRNPTYFHLTQGRSFQDIDRDDVLSSQELTPYKEFQSFPQQKFENRYPYASAFPSAQSLDELKQQNLHFENIPNKFTKVSQLDRQHRQTVLPVEGKSAREYFDKSAYENLFFRNPRNTYSSSEDQEFEDSIDTQAKEDPASKLLIVYRADREPSWKDSRHTSLPNVILPQESFANFRREDIPNDERNTINKSPIFADQRYDLAFPQERYYSAKGGAPEIKHNSDIAQDLNIPRPMTDGRFFDNWDLAKDSLKTLNLEQPKSAEDNLFEMNSEEEKDIIIAEDNEQFDYHPRIFPQYFNSMRPATNEKPLGAWNSMISKDSQKFSGNGQFRKTENDWPQVHRDMEKNIRFKNEENGNKECFIDEKNENREYIKDKIEKDIITAETTNYNSYALPQNENIMRTEDEELSDLDFTIDSQGIPQTEQLEIFPYGVYNDNNKYFQNEKDGTENEIHANANGIVRPPINFNPYMSPRFLNNLNALKYPIEFFKTQELPDTKNNAFRSNFIGRIEESDRLSKDEIIIPDRTHIQNISPKNPFGAQKYNLATITKPDTRDYAQEKDLTELDPDLMIDIEDPPAEPTESTLKGLSTSKQE